MGRRRTAKGHALPLPESVQPPDAFDLGIAGAAEDRSADLRPGDPDQDVRAFLPGRTHGEDTGLGGRRARRLYAELTCKIVVAVKPELADRHREYSQWRRCANTIGSRRSAGSSIHLEI